MPSSFKRAARATLVALLFLDPATVYGQSQMLRDTTTVGRMIRLGRAREFEKAAGLGRANVTERRGKAITNEHCQVLALLAFGEWGLDRPDAARTAIADFDRTCGSMQLESGYRRDVERVRSAVVNGQTAAMLLPPPATVPVSTQPTATQPVLPPLLSARGGTEPPQSSAPIGARPALAGPRVTVDALGPLVDPASVGLNVSALERHRVLCGRSGADACLVVHHGRVVQEWYSAKYRTPIYAMSSTKSVAGLLVGMLIDDGKIRSLDQRVCEYLSDWCAGLRGRVTLRHLLSMTSGLPTMQNKRSVGYASDKNAHVRALAPETEPGTTWAYSNEGVQLLSPILDQAAGEPIQEYAKRRLFEPLGMHDTRLNIDGKGHAWTYADMLTTPREFAHLGVLMAQRGMWMGKRVVSAEWIHQSVRPSQQYNSQYGLLWWTALPTEQRFAALGYLDTDMQIMPEQGLVVIRMQRVPAQGAMPYKPDAFDLFELFVPPSGR